MRFWFTKVKIKNMFGVKEAELTGDDIELAGKMGAGKSSVLDSIRFLLEGKSDREVVIHKGATEGEVYAEIGDDISIIRKVREGKTTLTKIEQGGEKRSIGFLKSLFTPLQLDPIKFVDLSTEQQNKILLDLLDIRWDQEMIKEWFGEVPNDPRIDWNNDNLLEILHKVQDEQGKYFLDRQDIRREIRLKKDHIEQIKQGIPADYDVEYWRQFSLGGLYSDMNDAVLHNNVVLNARSRCNEIDSMIESLVLVEKDTLDLAEKRSSNIKEALDRKLEELRKEIEQVEMRISKISSDLEEKKKEIKADFENRRAELLSESTLLNASATREIINVGEKRKAAEEAEKQKSFIREHDRMVNYEEEVKNLEKKDAVLTERINKARTLPGELMKDREMPVFGLTIENGVPLIAGLPVSNLSSGEKLALSIDISIHQQGKLRGVLLDGVEKLSKSDKENLYRKLFRSGISVVAARTTDDNELLITRIRKEEKNVPIG